jgi:hypothetical protein
MVLEERLPAANLLQRQLGAFVVPLLNRVAAVVHHLAGLAHIA